MANFAKSDEAQLVERQTYTITEAAKILGISRALAYREGTLPTIRVAGRRLVPKNALAEMLVATTSSARASSSERTNNDEAAAK